ncbi:MAG: potassium transporter TrkA [archaeon]|nr:potassium transporter TrkA [archaeon]
MSGACDECSELDETTVRELLTEIKDKSGVIVDLAYASLMYDSLDMAKKVDELKEEMEGLEYAIRVKMLLAARTMEEAKQLSGILQVVSAAERISRSAAEIAKLINLPPEKKPFITNILCESDEKFDIIRISEGSDMVGNTLGQLAIEACTGTRVIALKNRRGWIYDPDDEIKVHAGDDIVVRGLDEGFLRLKDFTTGKCPWEFPDAERSEDE